MYLSVLTPHSGAITVRGLDLNCSLKGALGNSTLRIQIPNFHGPSLKSAKFRSSSETAVSPMSPEGSMYPIIRYLGFG